MVGIPASSDGLCLQVNYVQRRQWAEQPILSSGATHEPPENVMLSYLRIFHQHVKKTGGEDAEAVRILCDKWVLLKCSDAYYLMTLLHEYPEARDRHITIWRFLNRFKLKDIVAMFTNPARPDSESDLYEMIEFVQVV